MIDGHEDRISGDICIPGKRTYLRPVEPRDAELLRFLINDPATTASFVGFNPPVSTVDQARWIDAYTLRPEGPWHFTIVDRETDLGIGLASMWDLDRMNGTVGIGVKLHPDARGRGLARDAGMARTAWTLYVAGFRRISAAVLDFNRASQALVERVGYRLEGRQREAVHRNGRWCDLLLYGLLRSEADLMPEMQEYRRLVVPISTEPVASDDVPADWLA